MNSMTITFFKDILEGVGRSLLQGKKKGGIKVSKIVKVSENVPCLIRYIEVVCYEYTLLSGIHTLCKEATTTFDKGHVGYAQNEPLIQGNIYSLTRIRARFVNKKQLPKINLTTILLDNNIK